MFKLLPVVALVSLAAAAPLQRRGSGTATYYSQNGAAGSCGSSHSDSDYIVAVPGGGHCGQTMTISSDKGSIQAQVADTCPSCSSNHIDLSKAAYDALGDESDGVLNVNWSM